MPSLLTRADSLREYLTGATGEAGAQHDPASSLGGYRSSSEAISIGMVISTPLTSVAITYASAGNATGTGVLTAVDADTVSWADAVSGQGPPVSLAYGDEKVVESANNPSGYVRVERISVNPITGGPASVLLSPILNNVFGFPNVSAGQAAAGATQYLATLIRNESDNSVAAFKRWIATLGQQQTAGSSLGATGSGTIATGGTFASWPASGYCNVKTSSGSLREIVYYSSRTNAVLTVPLTGRGLLGTSPTAGSPGDLLDAVPGIAIGVDPLGAVAFGTPIQTVPDFNSPPSSVTWNVSVTQVGGLSLGDLPASRAIGFWMKRQIPAGAVVVPLALNKINQSFNAL